jgi:hypothetical protein
MYMCDRGVEFDSFYDYYIGFRNCSERVVFVFQFSLFYLDVNNIVLLYRGQFHSMKVKGSYNYLRLSCEKHVTDSYCLYINLT